MKKKKIEIVDYNDDWLIKRLRENPSEFSSYVDFIVRQYEKTQDLSVFLGCLKAAIMARHETAGIISKKTKIDKSKIFKALSNDTNIRVDTFRSILNGIGLNFKLVKLNKPKDKDLKIA